MSSATEQFTEIFSISQNPTIAEAGGGHGQKGVDFQRFWAIVRVFELKGNNVPDFLILFEAVQDVAEIDSEVSPSKIDIYQIKKKDSGEWSFNLLTGLKKPDGRKRKTPPTLKIVENSPLGKLYKAGIAFKNLKCHVHFVSNAGCDLPLAGKSSTVSSKLICSASELDDAHTAALTEALALLHDDSSIVPDLKTVSLCKTTLHPDDPVRLALGAALEYLTNHLPDHAGQAKALVQALFMQLSTLGRQTEPAKSFAELRTQRGFSMKDMNVALNALQAVPDLKKHFDMMLDGLSNEGLSVIKKMQIHLGASKYFSNLVAGHHNSEEVMLVADCSGIAPRLINESILLQAMELEVANLLAKHPTFKELEIFAYLLIQVTKHATT